MAAVDFVTGYITTYVDGLVRPYVAQGAAAVGDVAGGVMFNVGDKISSASRGVGDTITGYSTGVGRSLGGVAGSIPGAPKPSEATKRVEQTASNPLGLSGQSSKSKDAGAPKPKTGSDDAKSSVPKSLPKSSTPSYPSKATAPTKKNVSGVASGAMGTAKSAQNKASSVTPSKPYIGGAHEVPKAISSGPKPGGGATKAVGNTPKPGGAHEVPKVIGGPPKPSAAETGSVAGGAPAEVERRSKRARKTRPRRV